MTKEWKYNETKNAILIDPPKQHKKITGHRIAGILNLDQYTTPFQMWCEITKLVTPPFEETKYTLFGKSVEPKLINYMRTKLPNVMSIEEYYGNIFNEYRYDNFKEESKIMGGVIDAVTTLPNGKTITSIIECKTSSHPEQWNNDRIPVTYALQGALYSYLKGLDTVIFICTFPQDIDYAHPENYQVTDENTIIRIVKLDDLLFEVNGEFLNIDGCMKYAEQWWNEHIETGISPEFDEKLDKEYLDIIRATDAVQDTDLEDVCENAYKLSLTIKDLKESSGINELEKQLKLFKDSIKNDMIIKSINNCGNYELSYSKKMVFDEDRFMEEHKDMYEEYLIEKETYTLKEKKGE